MRIKDVKTSLVIFVLLLKVKIEVTQFSVKSKVYNVFEKR